MAGPLAIPMGSSTVESSIVKIKKRSGSVVSFDATKISGAIFKALAAMSKPDRSLADELASSVVSKLALKFLDLPEKN